MATTLSSQSVIKGVRSKISCIEITDSVPVARLVPGWILETPKPLGLPLSDISILAVTVLVSTQSTAQGREDAGRLG